VNRLAALLLLVALALLGSAGPAAAHATLVSSDPADGATLLSTPQRITLVFDEPLPQGVNTVAITGPGQTRWESGEVTTSGTSVSVAMRPSAPTGDYIVGFRVVSDDGHPATGTVRFRLTTSATSSQPTAAAGPRATQPTPVAAAQSSSDGGTPIWPWVAGVIVLVATGAAVALLVNRRRSAAG
jgi:copper resistance protein C